jgi:hypothetical protein
VRGRAVLETLYSTGIRRREPVNLKLYNVVHPRGALSIWQGKQKKHRVVPIGDRAFLWVDRYLCEARPPPVMEPDDGTLFLKNRLQFKLWDRGNLAFIGVRSGRKIPGNNASHRPFDVTDSGSDGVLRYGHGNSLIVLQKVDRTRPRLLAEYLSRRPCVELNLERQLTPI